MSSAKRRALMPEVDNHEAHREKHYSVPELAKLWNVSRDTIRRVFADEPGVLVLPKRDGVQKHSRRYTTRLIPESVVRRVHLRLSINPANPLTQPQQLSGNQYRRGKAPCITKTH
jgi:hypothetical protein